MLTVYFEYSALIRLFSKISFFKYPNKLEYSEQLCYTPNCMCTVTVDVNVHLVCLYCVFLSNTFPFKIPHLYPYICFKIYTCVTLKTFSMTSIPWAMKVSYFLCLHVCMHCFSHIVLCLHYYYDALLCMFHTAIHKRLKVHPSFMGAECPNSTSL